jgi:hypothetical protein
MMLIRVKGREVFESFPIEFMDGNKDFWDKGFDENLIECLSITTTLSGSIYPGSDSPS